MLPATGRGAGPRGGATGRGPTVELGSVLRPSLSSLPCSLTVAHAASTTCQAWQVPCVQWWTSLQTPSRG